MEQQLIGVALGASSLLVGYLFHKLSEARSKELSYLRDVPQFTNMSALRQHLADSPEQRAEILVEGTVKKHGGEALKSEKSGVEGAARVLTTTTYKKVYNSQTGKWNEASSTIENVKVSVPFQIADRRGGAVVIRSVHNTNGFRQVLERVWQARLQPESRSIGDYATGADLQEVPNGSLTREYLLTFGTTLGAYGMASIENKSLLSSGSLNFAPYEVSSSIQGLISRNEFVVSALRFFSMVCIVGGGGILFFSVAPMVLEAFGYRRDQQRSQENISS